MHQDDETQDQQQDQQFNQNDEERKQSGFMPKPDTLTKGSGSKGNAAHSNAGTGEKAKPNDKTPMADRVKSNIIKGACGIGLFLMVVGAATAPAGLAMVAIGAIMCLPAAEKLFNWSKRAIKNRSEDKEAKGESPDKSKGQTKEVTKEQTKEPEKQMQQNQNKTENKTVAQKITEPYEYKPENTKTKSYVDAVSSGRTLGGRGRS